MLKTLLVWFEEWSKVVGYFFSHILQSIFNEIKTKNFIFNRVNKLIS